MTARLGELNRLNFEPNRGAEDPEACARAEAVGGFYGPWVELDGRSDRPASVSNSVCT